MTPGILVIGDLPQGARPPKFSSLPVSFRALDLDAILEEVVQGIEVVILVPNQTDVLEAAQTIRMQYPKAPIYLVTEQKINATLEDLKKNGISRLFLLPWEWSDLYKELDQEAFEPVKIMDISLGKKLSFDTFYYLSINQRYLPLANSGEMLTTEKMQRLIDLQMNSIYVKASEYPKFIGDFKTWAEEHGFSQEISETERRRRLKDDFSELLRRLNTKSQNRGMDIDEMKRKIVTMLLLYQNANQGSSFKARIDSTPGSSTDFFELSISLAILTMLIGQSFGIEASKLLRLSLYALVKLALQQSLIEHPDVERFIEIDGVAEISKEDSDRIVAIENILIESSWKKGMKPVPLTKLLNLN